MVAIGASANTMPTLTALVSDSAVNVIALREAETDGADEGRLPPALAQQVEHVAGNGRRPAAARMSAEISARKKQKVQGGISVTPSLTAMKMLPASSQVMMPAA